jgi:hypothetical protein
MPSFAAIAAANRARHARAGCSGHRLFPVEALNPLDLVFRSVGRTWKPDRCRGSSVLRRQSFPGTAGCSWPTFTGGLWHFWVLGSAAPSSAAESAPRQLASLPNGLASLQGPSARQGVLPSDRAADRSLAWPGTTVAGLPMPQHPMGLPFCYAAYRRIRRRRATASGNPTAREQAPSRRLPVRV